METLFPRTVLDAENYIKACDIIQEGKKAVESVVQECQEKSAERRDVGLRDIDIAMEEIAAALKKAKSRPAFLLSKEKKAEANHQREAKIQSIYWDARHHLEKVEETVSQTTSDCINSLRLELNRIMLESKTELEKCSADSVHNISHCEQLIARLMKYPKVFYVLKDEYAENEYISLGHLTEVWEQPDGKLIDYIEKNRYFLLLKNTIEWDIITPEEYPEFSLSVAEAFCDAIYEYNFF